MKKLYIMIAFFVWGKIAAGQDSTDIADSVTMLKNGYQFIDKITDTMEYFYLKSDHKRVKLGEQSYGILMGGVVADGRDYFMVMMSTRSSCPTIFLSVYSKKEAIPVYKSEGYVLDDDTLTGRVAFYVTSGEFIVYNLTNNSYARYNTPNDVYSVSSCPSLPDWEDVKLSANTLVVHYTDSAQHIKAVTYPLWKLPDTKY